MRADSRKRSYLLEASKALMSRYLEQGLVSRIRIPHIDEPTLRKLPYWKAWLYRTLREIEEKGN